MAPVKTPVFFILLSQVFFSSLAFAQFNWLPEVEKCKSEGKLYVCVGTEGSWYKNHEHNYIGDCEVTKEKAVRVVNYAWEDEFRNGQPNVTCRKLK